ncbi:unnamed protein product [Rhodiola kirilowii]
MEEAGKNQQVAPSASAGKSKLRYQLRSAIKSKDEKPSPKTDSLSSATRSGRVASGMSKSMNVLDLSGKDKSAKPPRRLSIPAKTSGTPPVKRIDSMTPISEARTRRSAMSQAKSETPGSEVSKSGTRRQYCRLSTASYWLSQIKLAENAAKHSISLGFFKLALEAGCEPKQQMRNELKAYARKHDLDEHVDFVKELFAIYNITESLEELQASDNTSEVVQGSTKSYDADVQSATSTIRSRHLQPKSLNNDAVRASPAARSVNKESVQKKTPVARTTRGSVIRGSVTKGTIATHTAQKTSGEEAKQKSGQEKVKINKQMAENLIEEDNLEAVTGNEDENKENTDSAMTVAVELKLLRLNQSRRRRTKKRSSHSLAMAVASVSPSSRCFQHHVLTPSTSRRLFPSKQSLRVSAMAPQKKVNRYDPSWKKQWYGAGLFAEGGEEIEVDVFKKLEKRKVLSNVEKSGLLTKAEQLGFTLSSIEKLGVFSKAEELGLLSLLENAASFSPDALASASLPAFVAAILAVVLIPDDSTALIAAQAVVAGTFALGAVGLLVGSVVLGGLQEAD